MVTVLETLSGGLSFWIMQLSVVSTGCKSGGMTTRACAPAKLSACVRSASGGVECIEDAM
eukprot:12328664-Karenia_brevis.AAC.1